MFEVTCWDSYNRVITSLTQWDINQTIYIKDIVDDFGLIDAPMFHFCNKNSKEALVVQSTIEDNNVIAVKVPNILLQEGSPIIAYMYVYSTPPEQDGDALADYVSSTSAKTLVAIKLVVRPRAKPSQYKYVENIDSITVSQIEERIKARLDALESEIRSRLDGLEFDLRGTVDSKISELEELVLQLEEWLSNSGISAAGSYIVSDTYEVTTDSDGYASLPFISKDNQANFVFINGLFAIEEKDYQIVDNGIQVTNSEFTSGEDVVTVVILNSLIDGNAGESISINVSSAVYETTLNDDNYAQFPFTYNNQVFHVFVNGLFATKNDYSIVNNLGIQMVDSEFLEEDDIVTFVVISATDKDSQDMNISSEVYEVTTDETGSATIPLIPKIIVKNYSGVAVQVFINGMCSVEDKDYVIEDGNIHLKNTEFNPDNNLIAFVVFKTSTNNSTNSGDQNINLRPMTDEEVDDVIDATSKF